MSYTHLRQLTQQIHQETFDLYWRHKLAGTEAALPIKALTLQAVARCNLQIRLVGMCLPLLKHLSGSVDHGLQYNWRLCLAAVETIGDLGVSFTKEGTLASGLLAGMKDDHWEVREACAIALGPLGIHKSSQKIVEALIVGLEDDISHVNEACAEVLGAMDPALVTMSGVIEMLLADLWQTAKGRRRCRAASALGKLGLAAAEHEGVTAALIEVIRMTENGEENEKVLRWYAAFALGTLVTEAGAALINTLIECLQQTEDRALRRGAADAISAIETRIAAHLGLATALLECMQQHDDRDLRSSAASAIGAVGLANAAQSGVIEALIDGLRQIEDNSLSRCAAGALGKMGSIAAEHSSTIPSLLEVARHAEHMNVRGVAAAALGCMGVLAITHAGVMQTLLEDLHQTVDSRRQWWAAESFGAMGIAAFEFPGVSDALIQALKQLEDAHLRTLALEALGRMPITAGTPEVVAAIFECLKDRGSVSSAAAEALSKLQSTGMRMMRNYRRLTIAPTSVLATGQHVFYLLPTDSPESMRSLEDTTQTLSKILNRTENGEPKAMDWRIQQARKQVLTIAHAENT